MGIFAWRRHKHCIDTCNYYVSPNATDDNAEYGGYKPRDCVWSESRM